MTRCDNYDIGFEQVAMVFARDIISEGPWRKIYIHVCQLMFDKGFLSPEAGGINYRSIILLVQHMLTGVYPGSEFDKAANDNEIAESIKPLVEEVKRQLILDGIIREHEKDYAINIKIGGKEVTTLSNILPYLKVPRMKILFIAKVPAPVSVEVGHYFQGKQGTIFWNQLKKYKILRQCSGYEDETLLDHGYGIADIAKVPREYGNEPTDDEYKAGLAHILFIIKWYYPKVVVFVYKKVLDKILELGFNIHTNSVYGLNTDLRKHFETRVFAMPLPGVGGCDKQTIDTAMKELAELIGR